MWTQKVLIIRCLLRSLTTHSLDEKRDSGPDRPSSQHPHPTGSTLAADRTLPYLNNAQTHPTDRFFQDYNETKPAENNTQNRLTFPMSDSEHTPVPAEDPTHGLFGSDDDEDEDGHPQQRSQENRNRSPAHRRHGSDSEGSDRDSIGKRPRRRNHRFSDDDDESADGGDEPAREQHQSGGKVRRSAGRIEDDDEEEEEDDRRSEDERRPNRDNLGDLFGDEDSESDDGRDDRRESRRR